MTLNKPTITQTGRDLAGPACKASGTRYTWNMKKFDHLLWAFLDICPNGEMAEDMNGQLIFYTGLKRNVYGALSDFEEEELDSDRE